MKTSIYLLLDRSGSMETRWGETINAVNLYFSKIRENAGKNSFRVTMAAFDMPIDTIDFTVLRDDVPIGKLTEIGVDEVSPRGVTPLYDAIGRLLSMVVKANPKRASIVIATDGRENASRAVVRKTARKRLDAMRERGYDVMFIGVDFDAFEQAASLGSAKGSVLNTTAGNYAAASQSISDRTVNYSRTGDAVDFDEEDRRKASGS